jgi:hypothetical protein
MQNLLLRLQPLLAHGSRQEQHKLAGAGHLPPRRSSLTSLWDIQIYPFQTLEKLSTWISKGIHPDTPPRGEEHPKGHSKTASNPISALDLRSAMMAVNPNER